MKVFFDLFPILLFFGAYYGAKLSIAAPLCAAVAHWLNITAPKDVENIPIYIATAVAIVASTIQVIWALIRYRKVEPMLMLSFGLVAVFGGATLYFHNAVFIHWKPTALYWIFALILLGAKLLQGKNLMKAMMGANMDLPEPVWTKLNLAWVAFFAVMGALNIFVFLHYSEDVWVNFKVFGTLVLTLVFVVAQGLVLSRYLNDEPAAVSHSSADPE